MRPLIACLVLVAGCASVPASRPVFPAADLARGDARLDEGCYACLLDARDIYAQHASGAYRAAVLPRLFEVQLLIVLRHKELAMPLEEERVEAGRLADALPPAIEAGRYLSLVDLVPTDPIGLPERDTDLLRRLVRSSSPADRIVSELDWLRAGGLRPSVRDYLAFSLRCAGGLLPRGTSSPFDAGADIPFDELPLISYRRALCGQDINPLRLEVARTAVPEFHEATYFLARDLYGDVLTIGTSRAVAAIADVQPRFPTSSAMSMVAGTIHQADGNCVEALRAYDHTLQLQPRHEDAMLGRAMCLSHLERFPEAEVTASTLIAAGGRNRALAYYWRAFGRHRLGNLAGARSDIDAAKKTRSRVDIHLLAGIIEHDQGDFGPALADLQTAREMSRRACAAPWYIARIHMLRDAWTLSAASFEEASDCYRIEVAEARAGIDALSKAVDIEEAFRQRRIATLERTVTAGELQRRAAALNAAKSFANAGDYATAVRLGTIALDEPSLGADTAVLREFLAAHGGPHQLPDEPPASR